MHWKKDWKPKKWTKMKDNTSIRINSIVKEIGLAIIHTGQEFSSINNGFLKIRTPSW